MKQVKTNGAKGCKVFVPSEDHVLNFHIVSMRMIFFDDM